VEPTKYYTPSIAPSQVIQINRETNDFLLVSLGHNPENGAESIFNLKLTNNFANIDTKNIIHVGERIRDIIRIQDTNYFLMILDTTPSLGLIEINDID